MKVLVAGATGMVGGVVAKTLASNGVSVRGLVRASSDGDKKDGLKSAGVETVVGDLRDAGTLAAACEGVDVVVSTISAMPFSWAEGNTIGDVDREGQIRLIDAAKAAGARRFVYLSFPHDARITFPLGEAKVAVEAHLKKGGIEYTILQASLFMEIWLSPAFGFDPSAASATIFGDGKGKISWVSFLDVARACVEAASNGSAADRTVPVGGPDALSPLDVVRVFESASGKEFRVEHVSVDALRAQFAEAGDEVQKSVAGLQLCYATSDLGMNSQSYLVGDGLKSVAAYAKESTV